MNSNFTSFIFGALVKFFNGIFALKLPRLKVILPLPFVEASKLPFAPSGSGQLRVNFPPLNVCVLTFASAFTETSILSIFFFAVTVNCFFELSNSNVDFTP